MSGPRQLGQLPWKRSPAGRLESYDDLLVLSRRLGVISQKDESALTAQAQADPGEARRVLQSIRDLRELLWRIFTALAEGREASGADLTAFNALLTHALGRARIIRGHAGYEFDFAPGERLDGPAGAICLVRG